MIRCPFCESILIDAVYRFEGKPNEDQARCGTCFNFYAVGAEVGDRISKDLTEQFSRLKKAS